MPHVFVQFKCHVLMCIIVYGVVPLWFRFGSSLVHAQLYVVAAGAVLAHACVYRLCIGPVWCMSI